MATLCVGNLSFILTDSELEYWFEAIGYPVESANAKADRKASPSTGTVFVVSRQNDQLRNTIVDLNDETCGSHVVPTSAPAEEL